MSFTLEIVARSAGCDAIVDLFDNGVGTAILRITDSSNVVLSEHNLSNPAFSSATNGVVTANNIADDTSTNATGTAAKCKWYDRDNTLILSCTVTALGGGGDIELNSLSIVSGTTVSITNSGTITMPVS